MTPFRGNDQLVLRQKLLANFRRLIEQTAWVVAQVQNQSLHPLFVELLQRVVEFRTGLLAKLRQADVTDFTFAQRKLAFTVDVLDGVHLDLGASQFDVANLSGRGAQHGNVHLRAWRAAQSFHCVRQAQSLRALSLDLDDAIAG